MRTVNLKGAKAGFSSLVDEAIRGAGNDPGMADSMIAGFAKAHDLSIVTANVRRFLPFGVSVTTPDEVVAPT